MRMMEAMMRTRDRRARQGQRRTTRGEGSTISTAGGNRRTLSDGSEWIWRDRDGDAMDMHGDAGGGGKVAETGGRI